MSCAGLDADRSRCGSAARIGAADKALLQFAWQGAGRWLSARGRRPPPRDWRGGPAASGGQARTQRAAAHPVDTTRWPDAERRDGGAGPERDAEHDGRPAGATGGSWPGDLQGGRRDCHGGRLWPPGRAPAGAGDVGAPCPQHGGGGAAVGPGAGRAERAAPPST